MFLINCLFSGTATAKPEQIEVELLTYITPQDIKEEYFEVSVLIKARHISPEMYPIEIMYFMNGDLIFNKTMNGTGSVFSLNKWFSLDGKPGNMYGDTNVLIFDSNGSIIGSAERYEPIYLIDPYKETAELQLVSMNIEKINDGILGWFKEDSYQATFSVKNMNYTFAFWGTMDFGDLGVLCDWKFSESIVLGPRETIEIVRSEMTEEDLKDLKTELRYCVFC